MTQEKETTASVSLAEFQQVCKEVDLEIESGLSGVFAQRRTWQKAEAYVRAISDPCVPVKSTWDSAEYAGYENPGPFQRLIGEGKWEAEEVWNGIVLLAGSTVKADSETGQIGPGIIFDETADVKRGKMTCGVGKQYAGCTGGIENCVTWVVASLSAGGFKTWVSADVYLPRKDWFTGRGGTGTARRRQAGVPKGTRFASKPKIALRQLRKIRGLGVNISYGGGDEVYGRSGKLREDHEKHGEAYAYFVPRDHVVRTLGKERRRVDELLELDEAAFETRSAGPGEKGPRYYEWALVGVESENLFLLLRRPVREQGQAQEETRQANHRGRTPGTPEKAGWEPPGKSVPEGAADRVKEDGITFCLCYVPPGSSIRPTIGNFIRMTGSRWGVEETIETAKGPVGWDENQFRKWGSLNNHTALAGIAMLRANMIQQRLDEISKGHSAAPEIHDKGSLEVPQDSILDSYGPESGFSDDDLRIPVGDSEVPVHVNQLLPRDIGLIRLSRNEIMRLAAIAMSDISEAGKAFHLRWSKWRRRHQAISRWHHRIARMKAQLEVCAWPAPTFSNAV